MKIIQNRGMGVLLVKWAEDGSDVWGFLVELLRQRLQQHLRTQFRYYCQHKLVNLIITKSNWIDWTSTPVSMKRVRFFVTSPDTALPDRICCSAWPARSILSAHTSTPEIAQIEPNFESFWIILNYEIESANLLSKVQHRPKSHERMAHDWLREMNSQEREGMLCWPFGIHRQCDIICPSTGGKGRRERRRG